MYHYLDKDYHVRGPLTQEQLILLLETGVVCPTTKVAAEGKEEWKALAEYAEFAEAIEQQQNKNFGNCPVCKAPLFGWAVPARCPHCDSRLTVRDDGSLWQHFMLAFKRPFTFRGRSTRMEYWSYILFSSIIGYGLQLLVMAAMIFFAAALDMTVESIGRSPIHDATAIIFVCIFAVLFGLSHIVLYFPGMALQVRRLHDCGYSGWWFVAAVLLMFFPLFAFLVVIDPVFFLATYILLSLVTLIPWVVIGISGFKDSVRGNNKYGPSIKYPRG